jgi:glycosyltransferase involved in cell wall biosynthesis
MFGMRVNILFHDNGVGLSADAQIIKEILCARGHTVDLNEWNEFSRPGKKYDYNIFLELFDERWLRYAKRNVLIPNQEWFPSEWIPYLRSFDAVLCKTMHAHSIFAQYQKNSFYIGFTSRDRQNENIKKDFSRWFHLAGRSSQKGTQTIIETWLNNPDFPPLYIIQHPEVYEEEDECPYIKAHNITYRCEYVKDKALVRLLNSNGIHICISEAEGFGHYINEGMSCEALVITTDAPPMNELVTEERGGLVEYSTALWNERPRIMGIGERFYVPQESLAIKVKGVMSMSLNDIKERGARARAFFLENDAFFKRALVSHLE